MAGYYDLVLGLIPLALIGVSGALYLGGLAATAAVSVGGLVAIAFVAHAMFVRAPVAQARAGIRNAPGAADHRPTAETGGRELADA